MFSSVSSMHCTYIMTPETQKTFQKNSKLIWSNLMTHIHCDNNSTQVLGDLYGRLSIVLVRANARAILARSLQVAGIQVDAMDN